VNLLTVVRRVPLLDHLIRTYQRYQEDAGDRLAAAVTFYWFLSLFPVLLIAIYAFRFVNGDSAVTDVQSGLAGYLPRDLVATIGKTIDTSAGTAGLLGLGGLVLSGLGWIDALREALRSIWHSPKRQENFVVRKLIDLLALVGLLATISASVVITSLVGSGPQFVLDELGVDATSGAATFFLKVSGIGLAALADLALFLYLFRGLGRLAGTWGNALKGAAFGAAGFAVLKLVGGFYVQRTTTKGQATYGTFAVVVGLLLFLNLVSRLILMSAAFAVTSDRIDAVVEQSWSQRTPVEPAQPQPVTPVELPGAVPVKAAANLLIALGALLGFGVALHAFRTVRELARH
jgi:membrane protein